ncbi:MAG TPA: hypothetical protein VMJ30_09355 [Gemmatimonadales bacterium]|nr:hypothetical protein [Gemmatimonadales bacterium]
MIAEDAGDDLGPPPWLDAEPGLELTAEDGFAGSIGVEELGIVPVEGDQALPGERLSLEARGREREERQQGQRAERDAQRNVLERGGAKYGTDRGRRESREWSFQAGKGALSGR